MSMFQRPGEDDSDSEREEERIMVNGLDGVTMGDQAGLSELEKSKVGKQDAVSKTEWVEIQLSADT